MGEGLPPWSSCGGVAMGVTPRVGYGQLWPSAQRPLRFLRGPERRKSELLQVHDTLIWPPCLNPPLKVAAHREHRVTPFGVPPCPFPWGQGPKDADSLVGEDGYANYHPGSQDALPGRH